MRQLLVLCLICFGILFSVNASTVDKDNQKGYEYKRVLDIIARENLIDSIANRPFCCLYYENGWGITVKKEDAYILYYGFILEPEETTRKEISLNDTTLTSIFLFDQTKIKADIYRSDIYNPAFWTFIVTDSLHHIMYKWNVNSICDDKYAQSCKQIIDEYNGFLLITMFEDREKKYGPIKKRKRHKR